MAYGFLLGSADRAWSWCVQERVRTLAVPHGPDSMDRQVSGDRRARCGLQAAPEWGQIARDWYPETRRASSGAWRGVIRDSRRGFPPGLQLGDRRQSGWGMSDQFLCPIKRRAAKGAQLFSGATPKLETKAGRCDVRFGLISIQEPKIHGSKQSVKDLRPCFDRSRILADHIQRCLQFFAGWVAAEAFSPGFSNTVLGGVRRVIR